MYTVEELKQKFVSDGIKKTSSEYGVLTEAYYITGNTYPVDQPGFDPLCVKRFFYNPNFIISEDGRSAVYLYKNKQYLRYNKTTDALQTVSMFTNVNMDGKQLQMKRWEDYKTDHHNSMFFDVDENGKNEILEYSNQYYEEHPEEVREAVMEYIKTCKIKRDEITHEIEMAEKLLATAI